MNKKVNDKKLQDWIIANIPEDKMLWKEKWSDRVCFMRDRLIHIFSDSYKIVGQHWSKSIINPVILTKYKDVEIVWQYNFYDWQIMIKSKRPLVLPETCFVKLGTYFYYQGIPDKYHFKPYSETNNLKFGICLVDDLLDVYAFVVILKTLIDEVYKDDTSI